MAQRMNVVFVGHVDHGKSTIVGRLLADTLTLPEGKLEQVKEYCRRHSRPFEYAFLIDALKDEQAQGITIDAARIFFQTDLRRYLIIDAPGHIEFLKNMVTGAARAEAAALVIDAKEGIRENSKRHGTMLSMLGIRQVAVLVNKMDLVGYGEGVHRKIEAEFRPFLENLGIAPSAFIPVSGLEGDNLATLSPRMPWYAGSTVLQAFDGFRSDESGVDRPLRMPVQDVYKFTNYGDSRRLVVGTVEDGTLRTGDELVFYPSGKRSIVSTIEAFNKPRPESVVSGRAAAFTLSEQIYITRGEIAVRAGERPPEVSTRVRASLFWLGREPMVHDREYTVKLGTARTSARLEEVLRVIDASDLGVDDGKERIDRHEVAECILKLKKPIAFDTAENAQSTSRFVVVDGYEISGGGIVRERLADGHADIREKVFTRNYKWEKSFISRDRRSERYSQQSAMIIITGNKDSGKKRAAKQLEEALFLKGKLVYFLGIGNLLYGIDADIKGHGGGREEHMRRLAEVAHLMMDAGLILIVTAVEISRSDLETIQAVVEPEKIEVVWMGPHITTDIAPDHHFEDSADTEGIVSVLLERLQGKNVIFRPW